MKKLIWFFWVLLTMTATPLFAGDELYEGFSEPPSQARPFVRWWWNGNCPTEKEVLRELDVLREAGIGGVEINPIAMPGGKEQLDKVQAKPLVWLSDEWNKVVKATCDGAKERGLTADLIVGSGWPFGGRFLKSGEQIQIVTLEKRKLAGPSVFESSVQELVAAEDKDRPAVQQPKAALLFLRLVPEGLTEFNPGVEFSNEVQHDGTVRFDVPDGNHLLHVGVLREGFREVSGGAPGADGPVLDHLNDRAVEKYLNNMSSKLGPSLGGKLSDGLRAMFCDSIELSGANWTTDFAEQFYKRRGYNVGKYLPFVLDPNISGYDTRLSDTVCRVRYDFYKTFAELFHERFAQTFHQWCRDNGTLSRFQANGNPWHIDMLNGFMIPDIPEGDGWIVSGEEPFEPQRTTEIHNRVWNKNASSAAHLTGKRIVSCESMTNTIGVFWVTLEYLKESDDLNFVSGVTHSVLHGYNYSPLEAGFPGWVQFGTFFSEHNSWWPYFRKWADRNARLSFLFQNSEHKAKVAILSPTGDLWSNHGLSKFRFVDQIWYLHPLWHALNNNGFATDYISDKVVQQATPEDGKLCFGPQAYEVLIVPDAQSLEVQTAQAIRKYAGQGGKILFVGQMPTRTPGYKDFLKESVMMRILMRRTLEVGQQRVGFVPQPPEDRLVEWAGEVMKKLNVSPDVEISGPNEKLLFIHYENGRRDVFFFTSINRTEAISFRAKFDTGDQTPWVWDPETGARCVYPYGTSKSELDIELGPLESLLLVFEPDGGPGASGAEQAKPEPTIDFDDSVEIDSPWQTEFNHCVTGEKFARTMDKLIDFAEAKDDLQLHTFAGSITYRTEFDAADTKRTMLSLGRVHDISEVTLNGKCLGTRWWGRHIYDTADALKQGRNVLEVKVTTVLSNYVRSLKDNQQAMRYAFWYPLRPAGLVGPVRLVKTKPR